MYKANPVFFFYFFAFPTPLAEERVPGTQ